MTNEKKNKAKGIVGTILFHIGLLIVLLFLALRTPLPLPGEEGVLVNLGYDETGVGTEQKEQPAPVEQIASSPPVQQEVNEEIVTQDIEEAPAISENKPENINIEPEKIVPDPVKETPKEVVKEPEPEPQPKIIEKAIQNSVIPGRQVAIKKYKNSGG